MDEYGGRNFILMGSQQLIGVPTPRCMRSGQERYQAQGIAINNNMITNPDGDKGYHQ